MEKQKSTFDPDYCSVKLPNNPWIVQPFEVYEEIRIEDIVKKHENKKGDPKTAHFLIKYLII